MRARLISVFAVLALSAALLAAPAARAQISILGLKNSMVQFLLEQISVPGEFEVTAEGVEEPEDGVTSLVGVAVSDSRGVWLRVGEARLNWSPLRLVRGEIEIGELSALDVELLRLPEPSGDDPEDAEEPAGDAGGFEWPRAPLALQIRQLALQRVTVAPGVIAEQSLSFDAEGALRDEGDIQSLRLTATRSDDVEGRVQIEYLRRFDEARLALALNAREAAGGLFAELAGLPPASAARLDVSAEGPFDAFRVRLSADVERVLTVNGQLTLDAQERLAASASLTAIPGPDLDPAAFAALAPRAVLSFSAVEAEEGDVAIEEGTLTSAGVQLTADGRWNRETTQTALDLALSVGPELAALIEGVDWRSVGFQGRLRGPFDALAAQGSVTVTDFAAPGARLGEARLEADVTLAPGDLVGTLLGRLDGLAADRLSAEDIGAVEIAVDGALRDGVATLASLSVTSDIASITASGAADLGAAEAALDYALRAPSLGPLARAYDVPVAGALGAQGRAEGPFSALRVAGEAALEDLVYAGRDLGRLQLEHDVVLEGGAAGDVSLIAEGEAYGRATVDAAFRADPDRVELASLDADLLGVVVTGQGVVELSGPGVDGGFTIAAPDLSTLDPLVMQLTGERLTGAVQGDVALSAEDGRQDARADLTIDGFSGFEARLERAELTADVADVLGAPSGAASVRIAGLSHPAASLLDGTLDLEAASPDGRTDVDAVFSLNGVAAEARGELTVASIAGDAEVDDVLGAPSGDAALRIVGLAHPSAGLESGALNVEAVSTEGRTSVEAAFDLSGITAPGDLAIASLTGDAAAEDVLGVPDATLEARLTDLVAAAASVAEAELSFEGAALTSAAPSGSLSLNARDIAAGGSRAPEASVAAFLTSEGRAEAEVSVPAAAGDGLNLTALRVDAVADEALGDDPDIDATVSLERMGVGPVVLRGLNVAARGRLSALDVTAGSRGRLRVGEEPKPLRFEAAASLDLAASEGPSGEVSRLRASAGPAAVRLREPLRISSGAGATTLENISLRLPGGVIDGSAAVHSDGVVADIAVDLSRFREMRDAANAFDLALPLASADLDMSVQADTRPASASASAALRASDLRLVQPDDGVDSGRDALAPLSLDADLDWDGARAALQAALAGPFGEPVRVRASLPVAAEGGAPALQRDGALSADIVWQGDIAEFWAFVPAPDHVLSGPLDIDLDIAGTPAAPQAGGRIAMAGGQYQNLETGTILTDLTLASDIAADGGFRLDLDARDGADGSLAAEIAIDAGQLAARLTADGATLVRRDDVTARLSADIAADGPIASPAITGEVRVDRAEVSLLGALPPSVADLGDVRFVDESEPEAPAEDSAVAPLDLRIVAPGDVFVRGRGLDSEWRMDLEVTGSLLAPRIAGAVERVRGRLDFLGRNFELERGAVRFTGAREIDPVLDISLEHDRDGFIGRIVVSGVASDAELAFTSSPPVPEGEVLPRTIFGEDSQSLGPGDALLLANGIAALTGQGGGGSGVRDALGLDVLRLDESADGTAEVSVGKNVTEDVFVGVNQPVDGSPSSVEVEVEVFPNFAVRAETGQEEGSTLGVEWRVDF